MIQQRKQMSAQLSKAHSLKVELEEKILDVSTLTFGQRFTFLITGKIKGVTFG